MIFQMFQLFVRHVTGGMFPYGFEDVLNRHVMPLEPSWHDGAAVEHQRRHIEPGQGHDGAGNRLVAPGERHDGIEQMAAHDEFDRIGDDLAADQRRFHAFRAHRNAVRNGDRVELDRRPPRGSDPSLHTLRQTAQVEIARHDFNPGVRDTDERTRQVLVREPDGFQHCSRRRSARSLEKVLADQFSMAHYYASRNLNPRTAFQLRRISDGGSARRGHLERRREVPPSRRIIRDVICSPCLSPFSPRYRLQSLSPRRCALP